MREGSTASVLLFGDGLPAGVRALVLGAFEQLAVRVVQMRDVDAALPTLRADPLFVVAALPVGSRVVPPALGAWMARELPTVPLCLLTEETLVRPSVALHGGMLHLVGAPLTELRLTAWLHALAHARVLAAVADREATSTSLIGGSVRVREQRLGALAIGSVTHDLAESSGPKPFVDAQLGKDAVVALVPLDHADGAALTGTDGLPLALEDVVTLHIGGKVRALHARVGRTDTEVRIGSPDRAPRIVQLEDTRGAEAIALLLEPRDVVLVSWPRGAVDDELIAPLLLDGLQPTLCALELLNRVRPTAFAAVALQVR